MSTQSRLQVIIGLVDQVTRPLRNITGQLNQVTATAKKGWTNIGVGAAGLWATGQAIQGVIGPANEMQNALGEVASLGVAEKTLKSLGRTALDFSVDYGSSATEMVRASYDIQSAIAGLEGNELPRFTKASGVLAKATKSDTATITNYVGTMYGIFKNSADKMGKANWVENLAGMTASSVQMFKTTGNGMSEAFTAIGASATAAGIDMSEQMAILGTLQSTMGGGEAGTKYKAFLSGVGGAQKELGMSFVDQSGQMLPIVQILDKIKGKYGDLSKVADSDAIKKAFGSDEAVAMIKLLMQDTTGLAKSIDTLGKTKGMGQAEKMAKSMIDPMQQLEQAWFAIRAAGLQGALPAIRGVASAMAGGAKHIIRWANLFPNLTKYLGYAVIAIVGVAGAMALWSIIAGGVGLITAALSAGLIVFNGTMAVLRGGLMLVQAVTWLFNAALWACPITWIIAGIIALIAVIGLAIYYWDDIKKAIMDTAAFEWLMSVIESVKVGWASFMDMLGNINPIQMLGASIDWLIDKINMIPGINIDKSTGAITQVPEEMGTLNAPITNYRTSGATAAAPVGGLGRQLVQMNAAQAKPSNVRSYGDVYITSEKGMTPDQLHEWELMQTP